MTESEKAVFDSIQFYERYSKIVDQNRSEERLETPKKEIVESIITDLNYKAKYFRKENFFQIKVEECRTEFVLNIILKYGRVEPVYFAKSKLSGLKIGSVAMRICKQLDLLRGVKRPVSLGAPSFSNYDELKKIVQEILPVFEDFKSEVLSSQILEDIA